MAAGAQLEKGPPGAQGSGGLTGPGEGLGSGASGRGGTMFGPAAELWGRSAAQWREMPPSRRNWTMTALLVVAATIAALAWYGTRTDWRTLYAGLDPEDTRQMAQVLTQAQISYDLAANGTTVRVPAAQLDKARLATAAKGGPRSGRMGFELFDKPNWSGSEFDEKVNYQRALEGELEH